MAGMTALGTIVATPFVEGKGEKVAKNWGLNGGSRGGERSGSAGVEGKDEHGNDQAWSDAGRRLTKFSMFDGEETEVNKLMRPVGTKR